MIEIKDDMLERGEVQELMQKAIDLIFSESKSRNEISMTEFIYGMDKFVKLAKMSNREDLM